MFRLLFAAVLMAAVSPVLVAASPDSSVVHSLATTSPVVSASTLDALHAATVVEVLVPVVAEDGETPPVDCGFGGCGCGTYDGSTCKYHDGTKYVDGVCEPRTVDLACAAGWCECGAPTPVVPD